MIPTRAIIHIKLEQSEYNKTLNDVMGFLNEKYLK